MWTDTCRTIFSRLLFPLNHSCCSIAVFIQVTENLESHGILNEIFRGWKSHGHFGCLWVFCLFVKSHGNLMGKNGEFCIQKVKRGVKSTLENVIEKVWMASILHFWSTREDIWVIERSRNMDFFFFLNQGLYEPCKVFGSFSSYWCLTACQWTSGSNNVWSCSCYSVVWPLWPMGNTGQGIPTMSRNCRIQIYHPGIMMGLFAHSEWHGSV